MKKILITGITGFAGYHLTKHFLDNFSDIELFGTVRSLIDREDSIYSRVTLLNAELTNEKDVSNVVRTIKPDEVYHLAALSSPAESFKTPAVTISNNTNAQINLLEALRQQELLETKVVIITSSEVYGLVKPEDIPIDEETLFTPSNPYAVSKIAQDYLALQYFLAYNMPIIRIRPFAHVGPRQSDKFVLASFAKQIAAIEKKRQPPFLKVGNLDAKRDFTDVRDMVKAYTLLMEKGEAGGVYNVGSGKSRKIIELLNKLLVLSTASITTQVDHERMRPSDIPEICCNYNKMHRLTGWEPEIPIDKTLRDILDYFRKVV